MDRGRTSAEEGETGGGVTYVGFASMSLLVPPPGYENPSRNILAICLFRFRLSPPSRFPRSCACVADAGARSKLFSRTIRRPTDFSRDHPSSDLSGSGLGDSNSMIYFWGEISRNIKFRSCYTFFHGAIYTLSRVTRIRNLVERWPSTARPFGEMRTVRTR